MPALRQVLPRSVETPTWRFSLLEYAWPVATMTSGLDWAKSTLVAMDQPVSIIGSARSRSVWTKPLTSPTGRDERPAERSEVDHAALLHALGADPDGEFLDRQGDALAGLVLADELALRVPPGQLLGAPDGRAGAPHDAIGVVRVDREGVDHPPVLDRVCRALVLAVPRQPWAARAVHVEPVVAVLAFGVVPAELPGRAGVGGAVDDFVGPPVVARGRHERAGVLAVDGDAAEAGDHAARVVGRGDIGPLAGLSGEPHDLAAVARGGRSVAGPGSWLVAMYRYPLVSSTAD